VFVLQIITKPNEATTIADLIIPTVIIDPQVVHTTLVTVVDHLSVQEGVAQVLLVEVAHHLQGVAVVDAINT